jgi:hypothetical protein
MRNALIAIAAAVTLVSQVSGQVPAPAPTRIEIAFEGNGVMSLAATNAPLRDILNEWKRKGGTAFDGVERLTGSPLTLQFDHRPESEVMASLLRNASGFVIGPRSSQSSAASSIEVVYVLATSTATSSGYSPAPAYVPPPQPTTQGNPDTEVPPVGPGRAGQAGAPVQQGDAPPPAPRPAGVGGVAVPVVTVPVSSSTPPPAGTTGTGPGRGGGGGR